MADVRSMLGVPVAADFASTIGTPVIVNQTTGFAYVLKADGSVYQIGAFTGTVSSVASNFTGGLISVSGSPVTTSGTLAFTVAGTSGGIPYFSGATTWATSAALAASAIVLGGGAGNPPATTTTGTGVVAALGVNVGSAGAFVTFNGALGTPSSGTATNLSGTASGLSIGGNAATVTTNANLTGPITSSGNATAVASQTGTGSKFVMDASPTLTTPILGVAAATSINFGVTALNYYGEGTWTPAWTSLTVVNGTGGAAYSGTWTKVGRLVFWAAFITMSGTATTASTANVTNINNLPFTLANSAASIDGTAHAVATNVVAANGGVSCYVTAAYTPTWAATNIDICVSGTFTV